MGGMTTTRPPSFAPRVVEHEEPGARGPVAWRPPEQTLRGALAGAEAAIGSWLVVAVVAIAGYVATAAAPELGSAGWVDAARVGSVVWLLGHGGGLALGGAAITLVPLGVTAIGAVAAATSIRRARLTGWWPVAAAVLVYTGFAAGFAALAGTPGSWRGVIGAAVVAALAALVAMRGRYPRELARLVERVPAQVRVGLSGALRVAVLLLALGLVVVLAALVLGLSRVMDIHRSLVPDVVSSVIIVVAQLVLLPTLVVWGTSYLAGPGFAVGDGTSFSPFGIDAGPLPVVPVLGALPAPGSMAGSAGAVVVLGVLAGAAAGVWLRRRRPLGLTHSLVAAVVTAAGAAVVLAVLAAASSGSVGPGRMAAVGPDPVAVGLGVLWQVGLGAVVTTVATHPETRVLLTRARDLVRERAAG